jgi:hypothetical protein
MTLSFTKTVDMISNGSGGAWGWSFKMNGTLIKVVPTSPATSFGAGNLDPGGAHDTVGTVWVLSLETSAGTPITGSSLDNFTYSYTGPDSGSPSSQNTQDLWKHMLANTSGTALNNLPLGSGGIVSPGTYKSGNTVTLTQGIYPYIAPYTAPPIILRPVSGGSDITSVVSTMASAISMSFIVPQYEDDGSTPLPAVAYYVIYVYNGEESNTGTSTVSS